VKIKHLMKMIAKKQEEHEDPKTKKIGEEGEEESLGMSMTLREGRKT
jgi:hypothetical protein